MSHAGLVVGEGLTEALDWLEPVGIEMLDESARLLTRRDRKYLVPEDDAAALVRQLTESARALTLDGSRRFAYESMYFDTSELDTFLAAARGRPRRFKVRVRTYVDSGQRMLEIKRRDGRGNTDKIRTEHLAPRSDVLDGDELDFIAAHPSVTADPHSLEPTLRTSYLRSTLLLGDGQRMTIDTDLHAETDDGRTVRLAGMAIIETKALRASTSADRLLWASGHRPIRLSKFCTSLARIDPRLPSNRWTRALRERWVVR